MPAPPFVSLPVPAAATRSKVTIKGFATSRKRITNRGKKLTSTIIRFRLSQPTVLVFVFRGPGPDCEVAARIPAVGLAGLNRFRFFGYIGKRPLDPGTYLLVLRAKGSATPLARTYLTVVAPGSPVKVNVRPQCGDGENAATAAVPAPIPYMSSLLGLPDNGSFASVATAVASQSDASTTAATGSTAAGGTTGTTKKATGGVLGEQAPEGSGLPELPAIADSEGGSGFLAILLLALLLASLLGVVTIVVHNLRQPRS